ncbi:MAG TPA: MgtC/SapB family protein [Polyangiaceae bacterium]|nr:MgtC/SapB family protein [Polyangiaceae bacterium]
MNWDTAWNTEYWLSIVLALLCGGAIGLERQLRGKPAGVRTSALVCVGTFLFVYLSVHLDTQRVDPSRVLGQVCAGIGFLGAGVMLSRDGVTKGVTSAAVIWVLAAIGSAIALKEAGAAVSMAVVVVVVLMGVRGVEALWRRVRGLGREDQGDD